MNVLLVEMNPYVPRSTPISLGYIGAYLKLLGHNVRIMNLGSDSRLSPGSLRMEIENFKPALVGFSSYQRNISFIRSMASFIKGINPSIYIAIGGPQAQFMPSCALTKLRSIDFICRSEGELAMAEIVNAIENGREMDGIPGVTVYLGGEDWKDGQELKSKDDLDLLPSPYLSGILDPLALNESIILTSRGCPFGCIFCFTPKAFGRKIRFHSIERVIEEMDWIWKKGGRNLWLADPSFSYDRRRTEILIEHILKRGLNFQIWLETRADLITSDLLQKMKRAGVYLIAYGLESASERVLSGLKKGISLEEVKEAVRLTREQGIGVELFTQYGFPGETIQDAFMTLQFVKEVGVEIKGNTNSQQMQIYFGTDVCENYKEYGIIPIRSEYPPYLSIGTEYETEWMSREEIKMVREAWKRASLDGGRRLVS
jgi:anaerobic magnesium-protoporphyrin IX monomethyl ester cyclase